MAKIPKPNRTKRGTGPGANLALSIEYHCAADGGPDFGRLYGRDDYGAWELPFANPPELNDTLKKIVLSLRDEATQARDEHAHDTAEGRSVWLKAVGAQGWPIDEVWWNAEDHVHVVDFPYRPKSIKPGDLLVLYAAGTGTLVGIVKVTGTYYRADRHDRWPWAVDTKILVAKPLSKGIPLNALSTERPIGKSIRQKSHVRLSKGESAAATDAFGLRRA